MKAPGSAFGWLLVVAAAAVVQLGSPPLTRIGNLDLAALLLLAGICLLLNAWTVNRARTDGRALVGAVAMWAVFVASAALVFANRETVVENGLIWTDELGLTRPAAIVTGSGEVTVTRRVDGTFVLPAEINGHATRFMFDTGATAVVLTHDTAAQLGLRDGLSFRVPISTANGRALAAPVLLDRISIGSITFTRMPALVSAPGMLHENLLGQTFLERLGSYEVRGKRLVLRAANG